MANKWGTKLSVISATPEEYILANAKFLSDQQIAKFLNSHGFPCTRDTVGKKRQQLGIEKIGGPNNRVVEESPFIRYDSPPIIEADKIVIFPDIQFPYHHAEFINHVAGLCKTWNVRHCVLAGDVIENSSLTHFDPNWENGNGGNGIPDEVLDDLIELKKLGRSVSDKLDTLIEKHGRKTLTSAGGVAEEWGYAKKDLRRLVNQFDEVIWSLGNHEGRVLRQMQSPFLPEDLKRLFLGDEPKVKIAPYYYALIKSGGIDWRVEHPKSSTKGDAKWYAAKHLCNIAMAHSHQWMMQKDKSGKYWGVEIGCCVDEMRLPYAAQRSTKQDMHMLGALIIRDGKPWLLSEESDWKLLGKLGG